LTDLFDAAQLLFTLSDRKRTATLLGRQPSPTRVSSELLEFLAKLQMTSQLLTRRTTF
jgi:hypothetical protein